MSEITDCPVCAPSVAEIDMKRFTKKAQIGVGSYGMVFLAEDNQTNEMVAIKESTSFKPSEEIASDFVREVSALQSLKGHPDIIKMIGYSTSGKNAQIVLDAARTSLAADIKAMPTKYGASSEATRIALYQIIRGMHYMNESGIWHRDLKPQNILVMNDEKIKITDFGLARGSPFQWVKPSGAVFTLWYRAPEILIQQALRPHADIYDYGKPAEVWSVGIVMWNLITADRSDDERTRLAGADSLKQLWSFMWSLGADSFKFCYEDDSAKTTEECKKDIQALLDKLPQSENPNAFHRTVTQARESTLRSIGLDKDSDTADLLFRLLDPNPDTRITFEEALQHIYFDNIRDQVEMLWPAPTAPLELPVEGLCEILPASDINSNMWAILIDWLWEVIIEQEISPGTFSLAIHILRCFFARKPVRRQKIQEHGMAALYLASLYLDLYSISPMQLSYLSANTSTDREIVRTARTMLATIGGQMHLLTSFSYFIALLRQNPNMNAQNIMSKRAQSASPSKVLFALEGLNFSISAEDAAIQAYRLWESPDEESLQGMKNKKSPLYKEVYDFLSQKANGVANSEQKAPLLRTFSRT